MLATLLSDSSMIMLGGVGIAKSMLIRSLTEHIYNARNFQWLLTKFSTPEEIFGSVDINKIKQGKYIRVTANKLPEAEIAFIDEIFKANSAILNTLLTILNEKIFFNGDTFQRVPLMALYSASNELPEDASLKALYDRILIRKITEPIKDINNWKNLLNLGTYTANTKITIDEIKQIQQEITNISINNITDDLIKIRLALKNKGILVSDRRFKKSVDIIRAWAYVHQHQTASREDLSVLQYIFWDEPEQYLTVQSVVLQYASPLTAKAVKYKPILKEFEDKIKGKTELDTEAVEIYKKASKIVSELEALSQQAKASGTDSIEIDSILSYAEQIKNTISKDILKIF